MVYRDFITMLIFGVLSFTTIPISTLLELLLVRYSNAYLRLFVVLYYKIYIVYIDFITTLIISVLHFIIIRISTFNGAFVSEIQ